MTGDIERRLSGMRDVRSLVVQDGVQALTAAAQILAVLTLMFVYSASWQWSSSRRHRCTWR